MGLSDFLTHLTLPDGFPHGPRTRLSRLKWWTLDRVRPARAEHIRWFHSLELPQGTTPGIRSLEQLKIEYDLVFAHPVAGRRVLDVGAWDGAFSFEAERRRAAGVLSTDYFCWGGPGWGTKRGYDYAHKALGSRCRSLEVDVFDLDPKRLGQFDDVLFLGVIYHLTDPLGGLMRAAAMSSDHLVVETMTANDDTDEPLLRYDPGFHQDSTNFFIPNQAALKKMLTTLGFTRIEITEPTQPGGARRVFHAWRRSVPSSPARAA